MVKHPNLLRKMTLYYFLRGGIEFDPDAIRRNITETAHLDAGRRTGFQCLRPTESTFRDHATALRVGS